MKTRKARRASAISSLPRASAAALAAAADQVAARWRKAAVFSAEAGRWRREIDCICALVARGAPDVGGPEATVLRLHLVDQLRSALIELWREAEIEVKPTAFLGLLDRLERTRKAIEIGWRRRMGLAAAQPCDGAVAAEIAHGLRSACAPVLLVADSLAAGQFGELSEQQRAQLGILCRAAIGLNAALNDLTDLAWGLTDPAQLEADALPLADILEELVTRLGPLAESRQAVLTLSGRIPPVTFPYSSALSRTLWNLTVHQLLSVRRGTVEISAVGAGDRLRFAVLSAGESGPPQVGPFGPPLTREPERSSGYVFSLSSLRLEMARTLVEAFGSELEKKTGADGAVVLTFEVVPRA